MSKYGLDKFYTKEEVVEFILSKINLNEYKSIIEPSAGDGKFSKPISKNHTVFAYDIEPEDSSIIKQDFLTLEKTFESPCLVIGNPPFGRNGSLALAFIKHSFKFADVIAFILPRSFKKQSFYDKIPLSLWKVEEIDLPDNSFTFENNEVNIPCVFQIYEKRNEVREKKKRLEQNIFSFVKREEADLAIRRVGIYAGKAYKEYLDKSEQSHYFIKTDFPENFIKVVNSINWEHNNTVGPRSISKIELIEEVVKEYG